jgi:hypothetical protein
LVSAVAVAGCAFDPCPETKKQERAGQLDGFWNLERVQVGVTPSSGLPFPPRALGGGTILPLLEEGDLRFSTTEAEKGSSCTELVKTRGIVTANYKYQDKAPSFETVQDWQAGRFEYDHKTGALTLSAYGRKQPGTVSKVGEFDYEMRFTVDISKFKKEYQTLGTTVFLRFSKSPF